MPADESTTPSVALISDIPARRDLLDYDSYADALAAIVEGLSARQTVTMGVFGDWGSGKTTLLQILRERLRARGHTTVWINVWRLENEPEIWGAFLQALTAAIEQETGWWRRLLFNAGILRRRVNWLHLMRRTPELLFKVAVVVVPMYWSVTNWNPQSALDPANALPGIGAAASSLLAWFLMLRPYLIAVRERVKVDLSGVLKTSPLKHRVALLERFRSDFEEIVHCLVGRQRLTVFVDDLDRCSPGQIVQILDTMKVFVEIPSCTFVIGLDRDIIERAILTKYADYENAERQASLYLEKLIGLPFDLPPLTDDGMQALVSDVAENLPDAENSSSVFALGQQPNPRKVKRTINVFLLLWTLAQQRVELRNIIKPTRLAKIVVIQHSYRDFFKLVLTQPSALGELEMYFRNPELFAIERVSMDEPEEEVPMSDRKRLLPGALRPFVDNIALARLLTLHPSDADELNFTVSEDETVWPLPEEEVLAYTRLTYAVDRKVGSDAKADRTIMMVYRRSDSMGYAGRISDHLARVFGRDRVFADVESIPLGEDFREFVTQQARRAAAMVVVIGPDFLHATNDAGPKIDDPSDYVRSEIEMALIAGVPVIPVLVAGATMPAIDELPESIRELAYRNALVLRDERFIEDMDRLIRGLQQFLSDSS